MDELPELIERLRVDDSGARMVAARGISWARLELTRRAAWCYWAHIISRIADLQRKSRSESEGRGTQFNSPPDDGGVPARDYGECRHPVLDLSPVLK